VLTFLNDHKQALECYNKSLQINGNDSEIWINKGFVLEQLKDKNSAMECYKKAMQLNPNNKNNPLLKS
jgi:tetratricopeptide (TPR) repeat protein